MHRCIFRPSQPVRRMTAPSVPKIERIRIELYYLVLVNHSTTQSCWLQNFSHRSFDGLLTVVQQARRESLISPWWPVACLGGARGTRCCQLTSIFSKYLSLELRKASLILCCSPRQVARPPALVQEFETERVLYYLLANSFFYASGSFIPDFRTLKFSFPVLT